MEEQFNTDPNYQDFEDPEPKRPDGLTVWCVFSFINAGFQFISNIFWFLAYKTMQALGQDEDYLELMEKFSQNNGQIESAMQSQLAVSRVSYLLTALLYIASFYGVLQMWKLKKQDLQYPKNTVLIRIMLVLHRLLILRGISMNTSFPKKNSF